MRKTITLLFLICLNSVLFASEEVILKTSTGNIHGSLIVAKEKAPVVLIISGSGPTDRDGNNPMMKNNSLKYLAEGLAANNISSLRFDKRAIGASQIANLKEDDLRFDSYIEDVNDWIDLLEKDERLGKIIVLGHSEGALIGAVVAKKESVAAYVSIAGSGRPIDEVLKEQLQAQPKEFQDIAFPMLDTLKQGKTIENVPQSLYILFRPSVQPYMISWLKYNPQDVIKQLDKPILILQGTTDIQVLVKDAELLYSAQPNAHKVIIENMNHVLKDCNTVDQMVQMPTYSDPNLPIKAELISELVSFINELK